MEGFNYGGMLQFLMTYLIIFIIIFIAIYIAVGIFLNKFNKLVYGKGTPMAFIPIVNIYLLGKLTVGKPVGLILVFVPFLTGTLTTNINGVENTYTLLPADISNKISMIVNIVTFGLFIYAIFLYFKLKKEKNNGSYENDPKGPLDDNKTDVINNIIDSSRNDVNINDNTNANVSNDQKVDINNNITTASSVPSATNDTLSTNSEPSEFMKKYQNNDK